MGMFNDLPCPFMVNKVKLWPVHGRPEYKWFIAHDGKPFYFRSKKEAELFAQVVQGENDAEGVGD